MKITGLKCATIGNNLVVRITTDEGVSGYGEIERYKPYLKWHVMYYEPFIVGQDPTNVERGNAPYSAPWCLQAVG